MFCCFQCGCKLPLVFPGKNQHQQQQQHLITVHNHRAKFFRNRPLPVRFLKGKTTRRIMFFPEAGPCCKRRGRGTDLPRTEVGLILKPSVRRINPTRPFANTSQAAVSGEPLPFSAHLLFQLKRQQNTSSPTFEGQGEGAGGKG